MIVVVVVRGTRARPRGRKTRGRQTGGGRCRAARLRIWSESTCGPRPHSRTLTFTTIGRILNSRNCCSFSADRFICAYHTILQSAEIMKTRSLFHRERNGLMHAYVNRPREKGEMSGRRGARARISFWAIRMLKVRSFVTVLSKSTETDCVSTGRTKRTPCRIFPIRPSPPACKTAACHRATAVPSPIARRCLSLLWLWKVASEPANVQRGAHNDLIWVA